MICGYSAKGARDLCIRISSARAETVQSSTGGSRLRNRSRMLKMLWQDLLTGET